MCPKCQHRFKTFKHYVDTGTGEYLADHVGRCDREESCGYHYPPREYFKANPDAFKTLNPHLIKPPMPQRKYNTIPYQLLADSMHSYHHNNFIYFLGELFGEQEAKALATKYNVGTARHWPGATIFWQVDVNDKVRTGKIMLYNIKDCRRVKEPYNHIAWLHTLWGAKIKAETIQPGTPDPAREHPADLASSRLSEFSPKQCLFGEHLLCLDPFKTVAITESEKTAVIASVYYPNYIWLAAESLEGLNADKCAVLKDRQVILYPDVNGYAKWHNKAHELNLKIPSATFTTDDSLVRIATPYDIERGIEIADLYIDAKLQDWAMEREWGLRDEEG